MGGWQHVFLEQTLEQYRRLSRRGIDVALTVGPWTHTQLATTGAAAVARESMQWLDTHLTGTAAAKRSPVRIFITGEVLPSDLYLVGSPVVELSHAADNPRVDVFVRVGEVDGKRRSRNVSDGYRRVIGTHEPSVVRIELDAAAHRFRAGSRIRLLIAGGSHPRFARNLGTDEPALTARTMATSNHAVRHRSGALSRLVLPASSRPASGEPAPDHRGDPC